MSKRKAVKIPEEVTRSTEIPAQKSKTMGVSLAREIISDQKKEIEQLKKKLAEVQEEACRRPRDRPSDRRGYGEGHLRWCYHH